MDDDEVVKQLMSMLGSKKQLKFRSASGKLLKVSLDNVKLENENSDDKLQFCNNFENQLGLLNMKSASKEEDQCKKFEKIMEQAENQHSKTQLKKQVPLETHKKIQRPHPSKQISTNTSTTTNSHFHSSNSVHLPSTSTPTSNNAPKKVTLSNRNKNKQNSTNQAVLTFLKNDNIKQHNNSQIMASANKKKDKLLMTSGQSTKTNSQYQLQQKKQKKFTSEKDFDNQFFKVETIQEYKNQHNSMGSGLNLSLNTSLNKSSNNANNTSSQCKSLANQSIKFLKEHHPEDSEYLSIIQKRMSQLQKVQQSKLKLDQQISSIFEKSFSINNSNSMINGGISFKLDNSFDASMISLSRLSVADVNDPLCQIFINYMQRNTAPNKNNSEKKPSFLFLYSQPMIDTKGVGIDDQLDYFTEENIIQKIVKQCKIDYIKEQGTLEKFNYWLAQGISVLHYCGHGQQDHLLFEGTAGSSVKLDCLNLQKILHKQQNPLQLVFVASCHSQETGKIFKQAGAVHVICIKKDFQILDQACKQFSKIFYHSCINNKTKICEAFNFAKKQLLLSQKFTKHEISKFILLTHNNHTQQNCISRLNILNQNNQKFEDLTPKPYYHKNIPSRVQNFIPRPNDLHCILKLICERNRFINIIGYSGIGKSTLVRQLVRYIQFRNILKDGVIYLDIRACDKIIKIFQVLSIELFETSPGINMKLNKTIGQQTQKIIKQLYDKQVLIVFDNCQNIVLSDEKVEFKKIVEIIMKNCDNVYFVFTNRNSLGRQIDYCSEKLYQLSKLSNSQAQTLFFLKAPRNIDKKELQQFFRIEGVKDFTKHPFFQFLNGHPQAICMTASLLSERSLNQLYDLLMKPLTKQLPQQKIEEQKFGINPLVQTAMKISLNVLKTKHKDASQMIKTLSLLPVGIDSQTMAKLFGKKWQEIVQKLMHYSLVHHRAKYYSVHPNIIIDVQNQIGHEQKLRLHEKISDQFLKRIERIYKHIGTLSTSSQKAQQQFLTEQQNYKAMILRQISFYGNKTRIKKLYSNLFQPDFSQQEGQQNLEDIIKTQAVEGVHKKRVYNQKVMQPTKKQSIQMIVVYYATVLFVMKNPMFLNYVDYGIFISRKKNKLIVQANLLRLKACLYMIRNKYLEAKQYFIQSWQLYAIEGCGLGSASCEGAVGYIRLLEEEYAPAKKNMENALKYYSEIVHRFGKHYLNRWLFTLKTKMNRTQTQLISHRQQAQKLLKQAKISLKSSNIHNTSLDKHKLGWFVFRFTFDNISLLMEASFDLDVKPKIINEPIIKRQLVEGGPKFLEEVGTKDDQVFASLHRNQGYKRPSYKQKLFKQ